MKDRITAFIAIVLLASLAGISYWYSQTTRLKKVAAPVSREGMGGSAGGDFDGGDESRSAARSSPAPSARSAKSTPSVAEMDDDIPF